jgi:hypothetical protein
MSTQPNPSTPEATKHTSGPWTYDTADGMSTLHPYAAEGDTAIYANNLGVAVTCSYLRKKEEQEANARLIAAAPDMLAVLKKLWAGVSYKQRMQLADERLAPMDVTSIPVLYAVLRDIAAVMNNAEGRQ